MSLPLTAIPQVVHSCPLALAAKSMTIRLALCTLCTLTLACVSQSLARGADADDWVDAMKQVHSRFKGDPGTFAQFGDSITVTMAFWAPLADDPKNMPTAMAEAHERVKKYLKADCWRKWKGA